MDIAFPTRDYAGYVFDLDGTLIDSMPTHYEAWQAGLRAAGFKHHFEEDHFYSLGGMPTAKIVSVLNRMHATSLDPDAVAHLKEEFYLKLLPTVRRIEPVIAFARDRVAKGFPVAIASGGSRPIVTAALKGARIDDVFSILCTPEDVEHGKPAPDMFLLAAKRMGVRSDHCLVLEDAEMGRKAAVAAHMDYVMIPDARARRTGATG